MAVNLVVNGITYSYPQTGDQTWGDNATNWASAVTSGMLQKAGGLFTLTAETDFGPSFGLKSLYLKSRTANPASSGQVRLAVTDSIAFRNNANSANLTISIDGSDNLVYNGTKIIISGLIVNADIASGAAIAYSKLNLTNSIVNADINSAAAVAYSKLNLSNSILNSDINASAAIAYSKLALSNSIVDVDINSAAAISRSKLASGSANHVIINDGAGVLSSEAQLATNRGGTNLASYTTGDLIYASSSSVLSKLGVGSAGQTLKVSAGLPSWASNTSTSTVVSKTANYTLLSTDDIILANADSTTSFTLTLPDNVTNAGKVYRIKKTGSGITKTITILAAGPDFIDGSASYVLYTLNEELEFVSVGDTNWVILNHQTLTNSSNSFTFSATAFGSSTNFDFWWVRSGDSMIVTGYFLSGTNTGVSATLDLPSGITVDTAKVSSTSRRYCAGTYSASGGTENYTNVRLGILIVDPSTAGSLYFSKAGGNQVTALPDKSNGNDLYNNFGYEVKFTIPISGWKA